MAKKATIRTRRRGSTYSYSFDAGKNPTTGKRRAIEKGGYATEQEAYDAGVAAYADWKSGNIGITSERIKLRDYLAAWLENVAKPNVSRGTYSNYYYTIRGRILSPLGDLILQEIRPRDVDMWLKAMAAQGLAKRTIMSAKVVLSLALKYAVYPAELIAANPCTGLSIPRSAPTRVVQRTVIPKETVDSLLQKYPMGHKLHLPIALAYHTGARIGEVLGLTWDDVDLQSGRIVIRQQIINGKESHGLFFAAPKTHSGERSLLIDGTMIAILRQWKAVQAQNELRLGNAYQLVYELADRRLHTEPKIEPIDATVRPLICTDDFGLPVKYNALRRVLAPYGLNAHSFRHTHATKLIEGGAKPVDVAARLGHIDATITQNLYTHDTEEMQRETVSIFARIVDK